MGKAKNESSRTVEARPCSSDNPETLTSEFENSRDTYVHASAETIRSILHERAVRLAREATDGEAAEETLELVEFLLGDEKYAVEARYVREVTPAKSIVPVPCTPPFVAGIVSLRGEVVSIIDLSRRLGLLDHKTSHASRIVILRDADMSFGLLTDGVLGIRLVSLSEVQSEFQTGADAEARYLRGVTSDHLAILDAASLLGDRELIVHDEIQ